MMEAAQAKGRKVVALDGYLVDVYSGVCMIMLYGYQILIYFAVIGSGISISVKQLVGLWVCRVEMFYKLKDTNVCVPTRLGIHVLKP